MTTVLVTGPIGGGKSTVCRYLEAKGYPVYDCDSRCKALYCTVPGLKTKIESELGIPFSRLDMVFKSPVKLAKLENIVYPLLVADIEEWKAVLGSDMAFIESAVALEKPAFGHLWDKVLLVDAPLSVRRRRNAKAEERGAFQHFDDKQVDYIIVNDSKLESLFPKIDKFIEAL
ncbi:MAG: dephospho-CoA kinase [Bacteroidales bacterium]|nr:dephospho-CoA kinase [Bacteroidales bacterium]